MRKEKRTDGGHFAGLQTLEFPFMGMAEEAKVAGGSTAEQLAAFREFGKATRQFTTEISAPGGETLRLPSFVNEFWTARQRAANRLHEISYRACFKPQLPRFFIERLTCPGQVVYDPFMGRGTTVLEAALLGRVPLGCDISPLSRFLVAPRLSPVFLQDVEERLEAVPWQTNEDCPQDLLVFYHPETLHQLVALRHYLLERRAAGKFDVVDEWILMLALNRLTGHSAGFFSVYTLPPNQAVSLKAQIKINRDRNQTPPRRDVRSLILRKMRALLSECSPGVRRRLSVVSPSSLLLTAPASRTPAIPSGSIDLVVTSPPFLDVVDYATDNWLRCWFAGVDPRNVALTVPKKLTDWQRAMQDVFLELQRVLKPGGHVAFEVGEIRRGKIRLEEAVVPCGLAAGLEPELLLINDQKFTKTANCWGVDNLVKGTNTNRVVLFRKPHHR